MWIDKNIFKKCIVTQTKDSYINIVDVSKSQNWDKDKLVLLSGIGEINSINNISVSKIQEKVQDLVYNIGYINNIAQYTGFKQTNIPFPSGKLVVKNSLYTVIFVKARQYEARPYITVKIYRDNIYIEDYSMSIQNPYKDTDGHMRFSMSFYPPSRKEHTYTFEIVKSYGISNMYIVTQEDFTTATQDIENLKTNIVFGEIETPISKISE